MASFAGNQVGQGPEMITEPWIAFFCEREEAKALRQWLREEGLVRPAGFAERLAHGERLRALGNDWYGRGDYRRALHCALGGIHTLDWPPIEQQAFSEEQRRAASEALLPLVANLAQVFLKRGDFYNADRAATAGLRVADKLPLESAKPLRTKLLFRRAMARGEQGPARDLEGAQADLQQASELDPDNPEFRRCLRTCGELLKKERREDPIRYRPPGQRSAQGAQGGQETAGLNKPTPQAPELPPAVEKFAECCGRCLGRTRRYGRTACQASSRTASRVLGALLGPRLPAAVMAGLLALVAWRLALLGGEAAAG